MSEPNWVALGQSAVTIDYIGAWTVGATYKAGDVVVYDGVQYLAVNPSTGQTPPGAAQVGIPASLLDAKGDLIVGSADNVAARLGVGPNYSALVADSTAAAGVKWAGGMGTTLPASPTEGEEFLLYPADGTWSYAWKFKYLGGVGDAYKWVFVGGSAVVVPVLTSEAVGTLSTWVDLATVGPRFLVPRAGYYSALVIAQVQAPLGAVPQLAVAAGAGSPVNATAFQSAVAMYWQMLQTQATVLVGAGSDIRARYNSNTATTNIANRTLSVWPSRVA